MSLSDTDETALLKLMFQNVAWAGVGDASGPQPSAAAGSLFVALFTADPGEAGSFANECAYTGYARQAIARSTGGFTVSGTAPTIVSNAAAVTFPNCTASPGAALTYFAFCTAVTGGRVVLSGAFTSPASYQPSIGNAPTFAIGALIGQVD